MNEILMWVITTLVGLVLTLASYAFLTMKGTVDALQHDLGRLLDTITENSINVSSTLAEIKKDLDSMKITVIELKKEYSTVTKQLQEHAVAIARLEEWRKSMERNA